MAVAGTWYPAEPRGLADSVDALIADAAPAAERPLAVIAPHAGYVYSGAVAAAAMSGLRGAASEPVVLLGPSHHVGFSGAVVPRATSYRTPLGDVPIDRRVAELAGHPGFRADDRPFAPEHSLESELPFLQRLLEPGWSIVPVLIGGGGAAGERRRVAEALRPLWESGAPFVVSSDFTHYGEGFGYVPFRDDVPERIERLDRGAIELIELGDEDGFRDYVERTGATICGRHSIEVLLHLAGGEVRGRTAAYDTSGRMTGDWGHSVSYAGVVMA